MKEFLCRWVTGHSYEEWSHNPIIYCRCIDPADFPVVKSLLSQVRVPGRCLYTGTHSSEDFVAALFYLFTFKYFTKLQFNEKAKRHFLRNRTKEETWSLPLLRNYKSQQPGESSPSSISQSCDFTGSINSLQLHLQQSYLDPKNLIFLYWLDFKYQQRVSELVFGHLTEML